LDPVLFSDYDQLRRFFYLFMFRDPAEFAKAVVAADGLSFVDGLWGECGRSWCGIGKIPRRVDLRRRDIMPDFAFVTV
jgi:hypothetical protein